ncbi:MAG: DUF4390 domain-containing protein [Gammaproteobacteria bacterium]|nr:MAG: DUF4390 domain-containing protein [Gammaproteobacteria bacterium]
MRLGMAFCLTLLFLDQVYARDGLYIQQASSELNPGNLYVLHATIVYRLTSAQKKALHNGLPIMIKFRVEFLRKRPVLDEEVSNLKQRFVLTYRALTQDYHLRNLNSGAEFNFESLSTALKTAGLVRNYPLIDRNILEPGERYSIRIRAHTEVIDLPTTIKLMNYFSDKWSQTSDWYKWPLQF